MAIKTFKIRNAAHIIFLLDITVSDDYQKSISHWIMAQPSEKYNSQALSQPPDIQNDPCPDSGPEVLSYLGPDYAQPTSGCSPA